MSTPPAHVPTGTYRLQLTPSFTLFAAAELVPYLAELGVSHVYCSPWLRSAPGSQHGYDVVSHDEVDPELGGAAGVDALHTACTAAGLRIVLDIVPNHMHVGDPAENPAWWDVLEHGESSRYASWFDVDWARGPVRVPVLGDDGSGPRADAYPSSAAHVQVLWRDGPSYRRFFDVDSLAGVRVEDPDVFAATHAVIADQVAAGIVDGLRVDHPDGLSDPEGYLEQLAAIAPQRWVVVEKILGVSEELPETWLCAGTTGYDAMTAITQLMCDPAGEDELTRLAAELGGDTATWLEHEQAGKRLVVDALFGPELDRLTTLATPLVPAEQSGAVRVALAELLVHMPVYRAYVRPGHGVTPAVLRHLDEAATAARLGAPAVADTVDALLPLLSGGSAKSDELVVRFQQLTGPVMAKGVEDTACYRALRLLALNEVGGDPGAFGWSLHRWHSYCSRQQASWPHAMTTLSTHDTKRSEDVRARLLLLSEDPAAWEALACTLTERGLTFGLDAHAAYLAAQTLLGAWPIDGDRLARYLTKATKEAKLATSWIDPDADYDRTVVTAGTALASDPAVRSALAAWRADPTRARADTTASLAAKAVQLLMPGVPDCYQGNERNDRSLADPDNRRAVDWPAARAAFAAAVDPKQQLTGTLLRLRRECPGWFGDDGAYEPLGFDDDRFVGFTRADRVALVATRRPWATTRDRVPLPSPGSAWVPLLEVPGVAVHRRRDPWP